MAINANVEKTNPLGFLTYDADGPGRSTSEQMGALTGLAGVDVREYGEAVGQGVEETDTDAFVATIAEATARGDVTGFYPTVQAPSGYQWLIGDPLVLGKVPFNIGGRLTYSGTGTAMTYSGDRQECWISELRRASVPSGAEWDDIDICGLHLHTVRESLIKVGSINNFSVGLKLGGRGPNMGNVAYNTIIIGSIYVWQTAILFDHQGAPWTPSTAYEVGDLHQNKSNGAAGYICTTAGTSASSGDGPIGTGTGIEDGTVAWDYIGGTINTWVNDNRLIGPNCQLTSAGPTDRPTYAVHGNGNFSGNANRFYGLGVQASPSGQTICVKSNLQSFFFSDFRNEDVQQMYEFTGKANGCKIECGAVEKINGTVISTLTAKSMPHRVYRKGAMSPRLELSGNAAVASDDSGNAVTRYPFFFMSTEGVLSATTTQNVRQAPTGVETPGSRKLAIMIPVTIGDGVQITCANAAGRIRIAAYDASKTLITDEWLTVPATTFTGSIYANGSDAANISRSVYVQNAGIAFIAVSVDNMRGMSIERLMGEEVINLEPLAGVPKELAAAGIPTVDGNFYPLSQRIMNSAPASSQPQGWVATVEGYTAATEWAISTAYTVGQYRHNDGGKVYVCVTSGTSAGSGGPTGTGAAITDGTAVWDYVGVRQVFLAMPSYA